MYVDFFVYRELTGEVMRSGRCPATVLALQAYAGEVVREGTVPDATCYFDVETEQVIECPEFDGGFDTTKLELGGVATLVGLPAHSWVEVDNVSTPDIVDGTFTFVANQIGMHTITIGAVRHKVKTVHIEVTPVSTLSSAKAAKNAQINEWRLEATFTTFTHAGKVISCDQLSRSDIDGTNGHVSLLGSFPSGWPGGWKAIDNTYTPITTVEEWKDFYSSLTAQGTANFNHAQALKAQLAAATTLEEVEAITW